MGQLESPVVGLLDKYAAKSQRRRPNWSSVDALWHRIRRE